MGYQNKSIKEIALLVKEAVQDEYLEKRELEIITTPSDDNRSYHINSDKIKSCLGFIPKHSIHEAVHDLCKAFKEGLLPNSFGDDKYFNVQRLKRMQIK